MPVAALPRKRLHGGEDAQPYSVLRVEAVSKRYGARIAVDGVDLSVAAGEAYGLVGPNGAGKTTLISIICGLVKPDDGRVSIAGVDAVRSSRQARSNLGFVPQELALYPELTARENLTFFGSLYGLHGRALRARVDSCLETVKLADRANDRIEDFSGGMRRRTNIAAALLHRPRLLVLDEPTVGVDPQSRNAMLETLEQLLAGGTAVLYASHHFEEVDRLCRRVGILDGGIIRAEGTKAELLRMAGGRQQVEATVTSPTAPTTGVIDRLVAKLHGCPGVRAVDTDGEIVRFTVDASVDAIKLLARVATAAKATLADAHVTAPGLEAAFLELTGRMLRE